MNKNNYESRFINKEEKDKLNFANHEAWKYESFYRYQMPFTIKSIKSFFTRIRFQKSKKCISCCNC